MNSNHFDEYVQQCQRIQRAFAHLPHFETDKVFAVWNHGRILSPEWDKDGRLSCWWINVAAHMSVAALLGFKLSEPFAEELRAEGLGLNDIVEALLIHDWSKRLEIDYSKKVSGDVEKILDYQAHYIETIQRWFPQKIASLISATGDSGVRIAEMRKFTVGEKIAFFSDYCTSGSVTVPFRRRLENLLAHFGPGGRYEYADAYYQKHFGMSHHDKLTTLLGPIEIELARRHNLQLGEFPANLVPAEFRT